ncbi:MAG: hypothetical protein WC516_04850 [Patescibacteria group bacterium]
MNPETRKVIIEVLQFFVFIAFLIFVYFATCNPSRANADTQQPRKGEWLCWVNSVKNSTCGTFGWHTQKKVALEATVKKCEDHCETNCIVEYCEKVK